MVPAGFAEAMPACLVRMFGILGDLSALQHHFLEALPLQGGAKGEGYVSLMSVPKASRTQGRVHVCTLSFHLVALHGGLCSEVDLRDAWMQARSTGVVPCLGMTAGVCPWVPLALASGGTTTGRS